MTQQYGIPHTPGSNVNGAWEYMGATINIIQLVLQRTGTYNQLYRRPYTATATQYELNSLNSAMGGNEKVDALQIAGAANEIIKPSAAYDKELIIPCGWNEQRIRFVMKVQINHHGGSKEIEIIQGYTDHFGANAGFSGNQHWTIDETGMNFYINSITKTRVQQRFTPNQQLIDHVVVSANEHVLANREWSGMYESSQDTRMCPADMFMLIDTYSKMPNEAVLTNTTQTDTSVFSSRINSNGAKYLASIMNGYSLSNNEQNFYEGDTEVLSQARGHTAENDISKDIFIYILNKSRQMPFANSSFTYADLIRLDPNVVNVTQSYDDNNLIGQLSQAGSTAYWNGTDRCTQLATMLAQAVPSIMLQNTLSVVHVFSTNESGQVLTSITEYRSHATGDISKLLNNFIASFNMDMGNNISMNNQILYGLKLSIDLAGETRISLKLSNDPWFDYSFPSFADAMAVPVLTSNRENVRGLVDGIKGIFDNIYSSVPMSGGGFDFTETVPNRPHVGLIDIINADPGVQSVPVRNDGIQQAGANIFSSNFVSKL